MRRGHRGEARSWRRGLSALAILILVAGSGQAYGDGGDPLQDPEKWSYRMPAGHEFMPETIEPSVAGELAREHLVLTLVNVRDVSEEVAVALSDNELPANTYLTLPSVGSISEKAARALSRRRGVVRLWGLRSLTADVAAALGEGEGYDLVLAGVDEVSADVARALAGGNRSAVVLGIRELSPEIAAILAGMRGSLRFPRLERLSVESASAFRRHRGLVDFGGAVVSEDVAKALLMHPGPLSLSKVKKLEPGVGDVLAKHSDEVRLRLEEIDSAALAAKLFREPYAAASAMNLRVMSPSVAKAYVECRRGNYLGRLSSLTPEAASELAKFWDVLELPGISELSPDVARELTSRTPRVRLPGIQSLDGPESIPVAEALARSPAPVDLKNLRKVSKAVLEILRKKATIRLPPDEKLTIVP